MMNFPIARNGSHLESHFLNGIEIGTARQKIQHIHTLCFQKLSDGSDMMRMRIVNGRSLKQNNRIANWIQKGV